MSSIPLRTAGIYKITCIPTGKIYIGSSLCIRKRWYTHRTNLRRGSHNNAYLQNAWDKHGADAFTFEVIESVLFVEDLMSREQYYLDTLRPFKDENGFNIGMQADAAARGRKMSDEVRAKMSMQRRGVPKPWQKTPEYSERARELALNRRPPSAESRKRQGENARGWHHTPEARQQISDTWALRPKVARHIVTTPEGEELRVALYSFCREHGLNFRSMQQCAYYPNRQHKGYKVRRVD